MGWVFLEIGVALAIAALIVWWTMPRKGGRGDPAREKTDGGKES